MVTQSHSWAPSQNSFLTCTKSWDTENIKTLSCLYLMYIILHKSRCNKKQDLKSCNPWLSTTLCQCVFCFQNVIIFYGTWMNVNLISSSKRSMVLPTPILTKLTNALQQYFPKFLFAGPLGLWKITKDSHILAHVNILQGRSDERYPKLRISVSALTSDSYEYIIAAYVIMLKSIRQDVLHRISFLFWNKLWLSLIQFSRNSCFLDKTLYKTATSYFMKIQ